MFIIANCFRWSRWQIFTCHSTPPTPAKPKKQFSSNVCDAIQSFILSFQLMNLNYLVYKPVFLQSKFTLRIIKNMNVCWTVTFSIFLRPEWRILWKKKTKQTYSVLLFVFISFTQMFQGSLVSSIAYEKKNSQKTTELVVQVLSLELSE